MPSFEENENAGNQSCQLKHSSHSIRLSLALHGETARILSELRKRGIIRSYADCVNQAILLLYKETTEQDLRVARLKTLQRHFEGDEGE